VDTPLDPEDAKRIVRRGYDRISHAYRDDSGAANRGYPKWLDQYLLPRLSPPARVLDLGCGNGVPATRLLAERFDVTGVDISEVQLSRARRLVPKATFIQADIATVEFPAESFAAVVSFFALIHVPVAEQPGILQRIGEWLIPGGLLLMTVGHTAWTGVGDFYGADMYWSHADVATYTTWLDGVGMDILDTEFIPEDAHRGHELVLASRRARVAA
jgi:SAM-dependent methyltransferase